MALTLSNLTTNTGRRRRRVGRGNASGSGTYAGRGQKGQRSRSGGSRGIQRRALKQFFGRIPKQSPSQGISQEVAVVNLSQLSRHFTAGSTVTPQALFKKGLARAGLPVKILGGGTISQSLNIKGCKVSATATEKIKTAGGKIID